MRRIFRALGHAYACRRCRICGEHRTLQGECLCRPLNWTEELARMARPAVRVVKTTQHAATQAVRSIPTPSIALPEWSPSEVYASF